MNRYSSVSFFLCLAGIISCGFSGCSCSDSCSGCSHTCHLEETKACSTSKENDVCCEQKTIGKKMTKQCSSTGLEWEVIQEGNGASPSKGATVTVHYTGWLNDAGKSGKKFDSSVDRGQPFKFRIGIGMVIAGWDEGVMSMKVGEKRRLYIPAKLGYGAHGAGGVIPPNADLIFDVELIDVA